MLPLLRGFEPDWPVVFDRDRAISAAAFCAAAHAISLRLPAARHAFNLCEGRTEFLLGSAAALLAGCTLVLPPSRLARTLDELLESYPDSCCLTDVPPPTGLPAAIATLDVRAMLDDAAQVPRAAAASPTPTWPPPAIDARHPAAILFTSGSTGAPQAHCKSWGEFCEGAQTLLRSFGNPSRRAAILGTVPPQHMFGFETTAMLPLQSATPLLDARPVYPADIALALANAAALDVDEIWLMSTPLQLQAFHRDLRIVPKVHRIISATMPLDPELARAIERDWHTSVEEIFGCTEGGILATRRPAQSRYFSPAAGLAFSRTTDGATQVSGGHLPRALLLGDQLQPELPGFAGAGRFEVIGRDADMAKIAGKRASLQALTRELQAVPGVVDGVMFLPSPDAGRIAAIVVAPNCTRGEIRDGLNARIDPAFMPRPLVMVPGLPRDTNGKLPMAELRAILAAHSSASSVAYSVAYTLAYLSAHSKDPAAVAAQSQKDLSCEWTVPADHPALPGHFPSRPIVPGVVLLERVEELLEEHGFHVCACPQVKFLVPVAPKSRLSFTVALKPLREGQMEARFSVAVGGTQVVAGRFVCAAGRANA